MQNLHPTPVALGLVAAAALFLIFVVLEFPVEGTPAKSLPLAAALVASAAGLFAYVWPRRPWVCAALLSSGFTAFFLLVFGAFLANGETELAPLLDALTIAAAGWLAAAAASRLARGRR